MQYERDGMRSSSSAALLYAVALLLNHLANMRNGHRPNVGRA